MQINLYSGICSVVHNLVPHFSGNKPQQLQLHYNSLYATGKYILNFSRSGVTGGGLTVRVINRSGLSKSGGSYTKTVSVSGSSTNQNGFDFDERLRKARDFGDSRPQRMQLGTLFDLSTKSSGIYRYQIRTTLVQTTPTTITARTSTYEVPGDVYHIQRSDSYFGKGWSLGGLDTIVEDPDDFVTMIIGGDNSIAVFNPILSGTTVTGYDNKNDADPSTLEKVSGLYVRTFPDGTKHNFNSDLRIASIVDRNGLTWTYVYDTSGKISTITDFANRTYTFTYTSTTITITDHASRTRVLDLSSGNLVKITENGGSFREFAYSNGLLTEDRDPRFTGEAVVSRFARYNAYNRVDRATQRDGAYVYFSDAQSRAMAGFDESTTISGAVETTAENAFTSATPRLELDLALAKYTDAKGQEFKYYMNKSGNIVTGDDGEFAGAYPSSEMCDDCGRPYSSATARNTSGVPLNVSNVTYDSRSNPVTISDKLSGVGTRLQYSAPGTPTAPTFNEVLKVENADGSTVYYDPDYVTTPTGPRKGNITRIREVRDDNSERTTDIVYNSSGLPITVTDWKGVVTKYAYGNGYTDEGNLLKRVDNAYGITADWRLTRFDYTNAGLLSYIINEVGNETYYLYRTNSNWLTEIRYPGHTTSIPNRIQYAYYGDGQIKTVTNALGGRVEYVRDKVARTVKVYDLENGAVIGVSTPFEFYEYDTNNNLFRYTDSDGVVTLYEYNKRNQCTKITTPSPTGTGTVDTLHTYDADNNLVTVTDPLGTVTKFIYDGRNRCTETIYAFGTSEARSEKVEYDAMDRVVKEIKPGVAVNTTQITDYTYNKLNQLVQVQYPAIPVANLNTNGVPNGTVTTGVRPTEKFRYELNVITTSTDITHENEYEDEFGQVYKSRFNRYNNLIYKSSPAVAAAGTNPASAAIEESWYYTGIGKPGGYKPPGYPDFIRYSYDSRGLLSEISEPLPASGVRITNFTYNNLNQVFEAKPYIGVYKRSEYDTRGRLTRFTNNYTGGVNDQYFTFTYDNMGRTVDTVMRGIRKTSIERNGAKMVTRVRKPHPSGIGAGTSPRYDRYEYDAAGRITLVEDAVGNKKWFTYDLLNRVKRITRGTPTDTLLTATDYIQYRRDNAGNVDQVTDPRGLTTTFAFRDDNTVSTVTDSLGNQVKLTRDKVGKLLQKIDRVGDRTVMFYDNLQRLIAEEFRPQLVSGAPPTTDTPTRAYRTRYDAVGRVDRHRQVTPGTTDTVLSNNVYTYDAINRLASVDNLNTAGSVPNVVFNYGYDSASRRNSIQQVVNGANEALINYTYNRYGQMTQATIQNGGADPRRVDYGYTFDELSTVNRYDNLAGTGTPVSSVYTRDSAGRNTSIAHSFGATSLGTYSTGFDDADRINSLGIPGSTATVALDYKNQVTSTDWNNLTDETFSYDAAGNRTGTVASNSNRLNGTGNTYDNEGRLTSFPITGGRWDLVWDRRGQLITATRRSSTNAVTRTLTFTYDALGRRLSKAVDLDGPGPISIETTNFVYDGSNIALCFGIFPTERTGRFLYGGGTDEILHSDAVNSTLDRWYLQDYLGSVRKVVNSATGAVLNTLDYTTYGSIRSQSSSSNQPRFAFAGRELDESDMYYNRARYYNPAQGRFLNEDPIGFSGGHENLYNYGGNNPVQNRDPSGLIAPIVAAAVGGAVIGAVAGGLSTLAYEIGDSREGVDWWNVARNSYNGALIGALAPIALATAPAWVMPLAIGAGAVGTGLGLGNAANNAICGRWWDALGDLIGVAPIPASLGIGSRLRGGRPSNRGYVHPSPPAGIRIARNIRNPGDNDLTMPLSHSLAPRPTNPLAPYTARPGHPIYNPNPSKPLLLTGLPDGFTRRDFMSPGEYVDPYTSYTGTVHGQEVRVKVQYSPGLDIISSTVNGQYTRNIPEVRALPSYQRQQIGHSISQTLGYHISTSEADTLVGIGAFSGDGPMRTEELTQLYYDWGFTGPANDIPSRLQLGRTSPTGVIRDYETLERLEAYERGDAGDW